MLDILKGTVTPKDWGMVGALLAVLLVVIGVFMFIIHKQQVDRQSEVAASLKTVQDNLLRAKECADNIDVLRAETKQIEELVAKFENRLPTDREIRGLVSVFEDIAQDIELERSINSLPIKSEVGSRKETIPYDVTVRGSFHKIVLFINELERYERYLRISDLKIEQDKSAALGAPEAEFTLSTYRFVSDNSEGTQ